MASRLSVTLPRGAQPTPGREGEGPVVEADDRADGARPRRTSPRPASTTRAGSGGAGRGRPRTGWTRRGVGRERLLLQLGRERGVLCRGPRAVEGAEPERGARVGVALAVVEVLEGEGVLPARLQGAGHDRGRRGCRRGAGTSRRPRRGRPRRGGRRAARRRARGRGRRGCAGSSRRRPRRRRPCPSRGSARAAPPCRGARRRPPPPAGRGASRRWWRRRERRSPTPRAPSRARAARAPSCSSVVLSAFFGGSRRLVGFQAKPEPQATRCLPSAHAHLLAPPVLQRSPAGRPSRSRRPASPTSARRSRGRRPGSEPCVSLQPRARRPRPG